MRSPPIDQLEVSFCRPLEKIDADGKIVRVEDLVAASEKFRTVRALCADSARRQYFARFKLKEILPCEVEENVLTEETLRAFPREFALQVRDARVATRTDIVSANWMRSA